MPNSDDGSQRSGKMIDTIKLLLRGGFKIIDYTLFRNFYPGYLESFFKAPYVDFRGRKSVYSWFLPIKDGIYRPRMIICKNRFIPHPLLYIEFSVQKLFSPFGENLYEVLESDFETVISMLLEMLESMGVETNARMIRTAIVKRIDIAKNFLLSDDLLYDLIIEFLRTSKFPYLKLLPPEYCYGGIKFNSQGLKFIIYNKLKEMLARNSLLAKDLIARGVNIDSILRVELQHRKDHIIKAMLKRAGLKENENTFKKMWRLSLWQNALDYGLGTLQDNLPNMILESKKYEEIKSLYDTDNEIGKAWTLLNPQLHGKSYEEVKIEAKKIFSNNLVKIYTPPLLIPDENRRLILPNFRQQVKDYKALTPDTLNTYLDGKSKQKGDIPKAVTVITESAGQAVEPQPDLFPGHDYFARLKKIALPNTSQRELFSDNDYSSGPRRIKQKVRESIGR